MIRYHSQNLSALLDSINRSIFALQDVERCAENAGIERNPPLGMVRHNLRQLKEWRPVINQQLEEALASEEQERTSPIGTRPFVTWRISLEGQGIVALGLVEKLRQEFDPDPRLTTITRNHEANSIDVTTKERFVNDRIRHCIKQVPNHYPTTSIKVEKLND